MFTCSFKKNFLQAVFLLLLPGTGWVQGIATSAGGYLIINGTAKLVLNNAGFTNNGTFTAGSGDVIFTGNTATENSFISGTNSTGFYNLTLNKSANGIQLNRNITVSNTLSFAGGDSLFLNTYSIDLGSTGSLSGETGSKRITGRTGGYIQSTQVLNAPSNNNPGNLGFRISSGANLGSTLIRRGHQQQGAASIYRYFDVLPTNNSGLSATVDFFYFDSELAGLPEPNMGLFYSANAGANWTNLGENGIDQTSNFLTVTAIDILDRFTLANISAPLAVKIIQFRAVVSGEKILLNWITGSESANSRFEIERSGDGTRFYKIGEMPGAGTTDQEQRYQFPDPAPLTGKNYYRLRQVDKDGKFSYSYIVMADRALTTDALTRLYPNPVSGNTLYLDYHCVKEGTYLFRVFNASGIQVKSMSVYCKPGSQMIEINFKHLPPGMYTISYPAANNRGVQFIKQ
ncbi:MAG: T9SS type A sorting domain-containing protein [Sphingobacteriales bacterium]|nr:T9SS type A sorting domain-containing protein [Sphingobacteriales bacterium]